MKLITTEAINVTTTGKAYIDDAKLTDHHAIIPTGKMVDPATLNEDQRKIYLLVAKRFLSIFLPPYKLLQQLFFWTVMEKAFWPKVEKLSIKDFLFFTKINQRTSFCQTWNPEI